MSKVRWRRAGAIYVDIALLGVILLLYSPRLTGLPVHEWLGVALGLPVVVHLLWSWSWIRTATTQFIARRDARARANYIANWILFVLIVVEVASGIAISEVALPAFGVSTINDRTWRALHNQTLNATLLLLGIHAAMNWRLLVVGIRRYITIPRLLGVKRRVSTPT
ncbi:MAG: DUF4405 domain-containing protein [Gemmatimonadaceae bacterium]